MNLLTLMIDALVGFVRRNPIFCLVVLILAIGAPSLLAGIASVILYVILAVVAVMFIASLVLRWRLARLADNLRQPPHDNYARSRRSRRSDEGDVQIHINRNEKRISDDVGDYVDFEEEKNE